jgi:hypothetical protein
MPRHDAGERPADRGLYSESIWYILLDHSSWFQLYSTFSMSNVSFYLNYL